MTRSTVIQAAVAAMGLLSWTACTTAPSTATSGSANEPTSAAGPVESASAPASTTATTAPRDPACHPVGDAGRPVMVPAEGYAKRPGNDVTPAARLATSPAAPLEACGKHGTAQMLANIVCADGQQAVTNARDALDSRVGGVASGGRCGHPLDRYRLRCPAGEVDLWVDRFWCAEGEEFVFSMSPFVDR